MCTQSHMCDYDYDFYWLIFVLIKFPDMFVFGKSGTYDFFSPLQFIQWKE